VGLKEQVSKLEQDAAGDPFDQQKRAAVLALQTDFGNRRFATFSTESANRRQ
jgi:hypothetical protein